MPTDGTNLAWRAVELVAAHAERDPDVRVVLRKGIPDWGVERSRGRGLLNLSAYVTRR